MPHHARLVLLTVGLLATAGTSKADIITVPDRLNQGNSGFYTHENTISLLTGSALSSISSEESVYFLGTLSFDALANFHVVEINAGGSNNAYQWGAGGGATNYAVFFPSPTDSFNSSNQAGDSYLTVLKINQLTGDYTYWMNPDLAKAETDASNTPFQTKTGGNTGAITEFSFRGLNGQVDYTGFAIYTGTDTPFVPEPGSMALLGLGGLCVLRRRRV